MDDKKTKSAGSTHPGLRSHNEDFFACYDKEGIFIVADGVGGSRDGAQASSLAVLACQPQPQQEATPTSSCLNDKVAWLQNQLEWVNQALWRGEEQIVSKGSATTICILVLDDQTLGKGVALHVGDTRLYRIEKGKMIQLTMDHVPYHEVLTQEGDPETEVPRSGNHQISQALGARETFFVETTLFDYAPGDLFLLCTDGMYNTLPTGKIHSLLAEYDYQATGACVSALVSTCVEAGANDNVTAVLVRAGLDTGPDGVGMPDLSQPIRYITESCLNPIIKTDFQDDETGDESETTTRSSAQLPLPTLNLHLAAPAGGDPENSTDTRTEASTSTGSQSKAATGRPKTPKIVLGLGLVLLIAWSLAAIFR